MRYPLCRRFDIDEKEIARRLKMFGLAARDEANLSLARPIIQRNIERIVDVFYEHVMAFPELARFVSDLRQPNSLRESLGKHLVTFGKNFRSLDYFESRLRVGVTRERIGLLPKWYIAAHSQLTSVITMAVSEHATDDPDHRSMVLTSVQKVFCLDASLAAETYHRAALERTEDLMRQLKRDQVEIQALAQIDHLTGLYNRRHFLESFDAEFRRGRRYGRALCLLLLDIDDFKSVNDRFGHHAGDEVLARNGELVPTHVRSTDLSGRIGGEELAVALVETTLSRAKLVADRVRLSILQEEFDADSKRFSTTASIGLVECTDEYSDSAALMRSADEAMYRAKADGKNCVRIGRPRDDATLCGA